MKSPSVAPRDLFFRRSLHVDLAIFDGTELRARRCAPDIRKHPNYRVHRQSRALITRSRPTEVQREREKEKKQRFVPRVMIAPCISGPLIAARFSAPSNKRSRPRIIYLCFIIIKRVWRNEHWLLISNFRHLLVKLRNAWESGTCDIDDGSRAKRLTLYMKISVLRNGTS